MKIELCFTARLLTRPRVAACPGKLGGAEYYTARARKGTRFTGVGLFVAFCTLVLSLSLVHVVSGDVESEKFWRCLCCSSNFSLPIW